MHPHHTDAQFHFRTL